MISGLKYFKLVKMSQSLTYNWILKSFLSFESKLGAFKKQNLILGLIVNLIYDFDKVTL